MLIELNCFLGPRQDVRIPTAGIMRVKEPASRRTMLIVPRDKPPPPNHGYIRWCLLRDFFILSIQFSRRGVAAALLRFN